MFLYISLFLSPFCYTSTTQSGYLNYAHFKNCFNLKFCNRIYFCNSQKPCLRPSRRRAQNALISKRATSEKSSKLSSKNILSTGTTWWRKMILRANTAPTSTNLSRVAAKCSTSLMFM